MGRRIRDHVYAALKPVGDAAPHRYTWNRDNPLTLSRRETIEAAPYKEGEIIMVTGDGGSARKAIILGVFAEPDFFGDWREVYRISPETKAGAWSRLWEMTTPGPVQRGYHRAGLAPELDGKVD